MLTLLIAKFDEAFMVDEPSTILYMAAAELVVFDAPMVVILFVMWRSV